MKTVVAHLPACPLGSRYDAPPDRHSRTGGEAAASLEIAPLNHSDNLVSFSSFMYFLKKYFLNVYLFLRETARDHRRDRETGREDLKWALWSRQPDAGLELTNREITT